MLPRRAVFFFFPLIYLLKKFSLKNFDKVTGSANLVSLTVNLIKYPFLAFICTLREQFPLITIFVRKFNLESALVGRDAQKQTDVILNTILKLYEVLE